MNWYTPVGYGGIYAAGERGNDPDAMNGNAVMYDVMAGKILAVGGATSYQDVQATSNTHIITIGEPNTTASVVQTASMANARAFANSIALPDGTVCALNLSLNDLPERPNADATKL
jgi:galactose oxidase